jgi:CheY-like chemotaxis protein
MTIGLGALRLLVVDDNPQMRSIIGTVLTAAGVRMLHYAPDGLRGLDAVADFKPDICYVDYEMPVMNGLDFISAVRKPGTAHQFLPIIMLTGHSDMIRLNAARNRGVTEFLCKPVSARSILDRLSAVILHPRAFITAPNYFGPDRRRKATKAYDGPRRRATDNAAVFEL